MALTGLTWSFGWYRTAAYALFGATAPKEANTPRPEYQSKKEKDTTQHPHPEKQRNADRRTAPPFNYALWDEAANQVRQLYPTYKFIKLGTKDIEVAPHPNSDRRQTDKIQFDTQTGKLGNISYYKDVRPHRH